MDRTKFPFLDESGNYIMPPGIEPKIAWPLEKFEEIEKALHDEGFDTAEPAERAEIYMRNFRRLKESKPDGPK